MSTKSVSKVVVIGAGVGGLTCAALLARAGYDVTVLEAQTYPGGCASTWAHKGFRFESGATVAGGFHHNGPHKIVGDMLGITWPVKPHSPAWVVHLPGYDVALTADYGDVLRQFPHTEKFWVQQRAIADVAWKLAGDGVPWPPTSRAEVMQLARLVIKHFPADLKLAPFVFQTVREWAAHAGLAHDTAFMRFLDGQLLISAQTTAEHANAVWGATALDLARQGVYHVRGGMGGLALALVDALRDNGGRLVYRQRAVRLDVSNGQVLGVWARHGRIGSEETFYPADFVVANLTPWDVNMLLGDHSPASLRRELERRANGWGAFVLHLGVREEVIPPDFPDHHQLLLDIDGPLGETRSIFMSIAPEWDDTRAPAGQRAITITTHTDPARWWQLLDTQRETYYRLKDEYTEKIIDAVETLLPGFREAITLLLPGTPVTYQYYTDRHNGLVGGFPMTSLLKARGPRTGISNLRLVGDSIFPGQSTAGVTLGALRVSADVQRSLGLYTTHISPHPVMLTVEDDDRELVR